jgi:hypothetical protein
MTSWACCRRYGWIRTLVAASTKPASSSRHAWSPLRQLQVLLAETKAILPLEGTEYALR